LLPVDQQVVVEGEEEGEDPRWELIRQLVEYKKFKDAAAQLQALETRQENIFPRLPGKIEFTSLEAPAKTEAGIFDLLNAVNAVLKRFQQKDAGTREIFEDKWTVSEKIEFVLATISERGAVKFSELFATAANRSEVVCTFLALLELIRLKQLMCLQTDAFEEIEIRRAEAIVPPAESPAESPAMAATETTATVEPPAAAPHIDPPAGQPMATENPQ
ncbi:MAG: segregation/condensation protein A, partial [Verrucomicrobiota bacterium]